MLCIRHESDLDRVDDAAVRRFVAARLRDINPPPPPPDDWPDASGAVYVVEPGDEIEGVSYAFAGRHGLLSDLADSYRCREDGFMRPYEWVCFHPALQAFEAFLMVGGDEGASILIPEAVTQAHPDLLWVLTDPAAGGLVDPVPVPAA